MEISRLQSKYGEEFDPQEVVSAALAQGNTNLEAVFKQIAFDRISSKEADFCKEKCGSDRGEESGIRCFGCIFCSFG